MNKRILLLCVIIPILFGCKKDPFRNPIDLEPRYVLPDSLRCTATKEVPGLGEIFWTANFDAIEINNMLAFSFVTYSDSVNVYLREYLLFGNLEIQKGIQLLNNNPESFPYASYSTTVSDGDVFDANWELDISKSNYLEFIEIDTISRLVSGRFDVYFNLSTQGTINQHSEYINFKNGKFKMKY